MKKTNKLTELNPKEVLWEAVWKFMWVTTCAELAFPILNTVKDSTIVNPLWGTFLQSLQTTIIFKLNSYEKNC